MVLKSWLKPAGHKWQRTPRTPLWLRRQQRVCGEVWRGLIEGKSNEFPWHQCHAHNCSHYMLLWSTVRPTILQSCLKLLYKFKRGAVVLARSDTMADPMNPSGRRRFRRVTTCKANSCLICATHQTKPDMLRHHMSCLRTKNSGQGIQRALYHELPLVPCIYINIYIASLNPFKRCHSIHSLKMKRRTTTIILWGQEHYHPVAFWRMSMDEICLWLSCRFKEHPGIQNRLCRIAAGLGAVEQKGGRHCVQGCAGALPSKVCL